MAPAAPPEGAGDGVPSPWSAPQASAEQPGQPGQPGQPEVTGNGDLESGATIRFSAAALKREIAQREADDEVSADAGTTADAAPTTNAGTTAGADPPTDAG
ncbi:topoisomerase II, partial [Streptomyces pilosus]